MREIDAFEVVCYENDDGEICLDFNGAAVSFTRERFIEFAANLNHVREALLRERAAFLADPVANAAQTVNQSLGI